MVIEHPNEHTNTPIPESTSIPEPPSIPEPTPIPESASVPVATSVTEPTPDKPRRRRRNNRNHRKRILEVNGKLVVGAGRSDLARLLAVAPDAAQIIVLRKSESLAALRTLRSENLRLTHRISYLEEQVRDLLSPVRTEVTVEQPPTSHDGVQVFQKGPQVTALVGNLPGLNARSPVEIRSNLQTIRSRHSDNSRQLNNPKSPKNFDFTSNSNQKLNNHEKNNTMSFQLTRSTASLDCKSSQLQLKSQRRRSTTFDSNISQLQQKTRRNTHGFNSMEFDSEPTYYRMRESQSHASEHSELSYTSQEMKIRPAPPKKPLRLSLHRAASLQSVESAPPSAPMEISRKSTKRNYRGDVSLEKNNNLGNSEINCHSIDNHIAPQPPPRTPSRAESCQSALRWPSPKPRPHLASIAMDKWC
ncbi:hypothetical protein PV327_010197 [Microctonus hyperodae]|uniref:Uncharacterized protein n=1 Tax=Microctonus hyperodae TaxID=165561 RepID=A0AA39KUJ3_MICHY|nr:hypothetical protein PV327_010197 [Microctonus hyperodae]